VTERLAGAVEDNSTWWVPLTYTSATELDFVNTMPRKWIPVGQREVTIDNIPEKDWVLFNIQLAG